MRQQCDFIHNEDDGRCPRPAVMAMVAECAHGHARRPNFCDGHYGVAIACVECWDGADAHDCPLTFLSVVQS